MVYLFNYTPSIKLVLILCLFYCLDGTTSLATIRKKRDNEAVLYGNQQSAPHLSVKKSGPDSLESHMKSQYDHSYADEQEKQPGDIFEYRRRKKFLKRAKRALIKRSMENDMASNQMNMRRKRYADDVDPETLERLRNILQNTYDSYYGGDISGDNSAGDEEDEVPYLVKDPLFDTMPEIVQKRDIAELNPDINNENYEIIEVNGVTGLFFPLTNIIKEKREEYRSKREDYRRKRNEYKRRQEELEESLYNRKLEHLAELLARDGQ